MNASWSFRRVWWPATLLAAWLCAVPAVGAAGVDSLFDQANKLYEQGKYADAAAAYGQVVTTADGSATVWFNLGNAQFKAGQTGRAIAAWLQAEQLAPRDPAVRFNLAFARKRVTGAETAPGPLWQRTLRSLTLNEWTVLAACVSWVWFTLLALREFQPALRPALRGYTFTAGAATLLLAGCLAAAVAAQSRLRPGVVVVPEAILRSGPLDEARTLHPMRDGTEVTVLDMKPVGGGPNPVSWLEVRDAAGRTGWAKADQFAVIGSRR
ncbi:MAG: hypothetical protein RJA22_2067 [Verrucomicrobiota bacterium]|jgi:tetratricopeptide (TPR) repeat protein